MLGDADIDAVIIAVADEFHLEAITKALKAGKHVLVEKPMGDDLEAAKRLIPLLEESRLVFQVGHMKRYDPGISAAREFVDKSLGEMLALKAWYCDSTHRYTVTDNVQPIPFKSKSAKKPAIDPKLDKKKYFMLAHGSHLLDTAYFLGGKIKSIRAKLVEKFGAFSWFADVEFHNGCNGHLDLTIPVRMDWHEGFQVYGEYGSIIGKTYNPWYFKSSDVTCFDERKKEYRQLLGADAHFYRLQLEGFSDTILHSAKQFGTNLQEGIHNIRAMLAMYQSSETGKRVRLDEVEGVL